MKNFIRAIEALSIDCSELTDNFIPFDVDKLSEACVMFRVVNDSNRDVFLSFDGGLNRHEFISSGEAIQRQFEAKSQGKGNRPRLAKGTNVGLIGSGKKGKGRIYFIGYY